MIDEAVYYLVFDDACDLCQRLCRTVQQADHRHRLHAVTFGDPLAAKLLAALPPEQWRNTFHLVFPDGTLKSGDAAMPEIVRLLPFGRPLAWLMTVSVVGRPLVSLAYRRLARAHRPKD